METFIEKIYRLERVDRGVQDSGADSGRFRDHYSQESIVDYSQLIPSNESGCCHGTVTALMGLDGGRTMACLQRLSALLWVEMASHSHSGHRQTTFLGLFSNIVYNVHNLNHPPFVSFGLII